MLSNYISLKSNVNTIFRYLFNLTMSLCQNKVDNNNLGDTLLFPFLILVLLLTVIYNITVTTIVSTSTVEERTIRAKNYKEDVLLQTVINLEKGCCNVAKS